MALISCPECGKEISNKSKHCVHCGYKLSKKITKKQKIFIIVLSVLLLITFTFTIKKVFFSQTESSDILEQLLKSKHPEDIKNLFGENYETTNYDNEISSKVESYENFKINDLDCNLLTLHYEGDTYTAYNCSIFNLDIQHLNFIKRKMIGIFGNNYNFNSEDDDEIYYWDLPTNETISLSILDYSDAEPYYIQIYKTLKP